MKTRFNPKKLFKAIASTKAGKFVAKNSPWILTSIGIIGMGGTVVIGSKATLKTKEFMDELKEEGTEFKELPTKEKLRVLSKNYWSTAVVFISSAACLCGSTHIGAKRAAALAASYEISQNLIDELRKEMREKLGEDEAKKIEEEAVQKVVADSKAVVPKHASRYGNDLICDAVSGRYFYDDANHIRESVCKFSEKLLKDTMYASLNDLYDEIDNPDLGHVEAGLYLGWNCDCIPVVSFSTVMSPDGHPALYMSWEPGRRPFAGFENF